MKAAWLGGDGKPTTFLDDQNQGRNATRGDTPVCPARGNIVHPTHTLLGGVARLSACHVLETLEQMQCARSCKGRNFLMFIYRQHAATRALPHLLVPFLDNHVLSIAQPTFSRPQRHRLFAPPPEASFAGAARLADSSSPFSSWTLQILYTTSIPMISNAASIIMGLWLDSLPMCGWHSPENEICKFFKK